MSVRVEQIGTATLILGDCREVLPTLSGVDAVVTDPPFGVRDEAWDAMSDHEFARFTMHWLSAAGRLAPELITFGTIDSQIRKLCEMIYPRVRTMFWHKPPGSQYPGARERTRWFAFEAIFHCYTPETWSVVEPKSLAVGQLIREARERSALSKGAVDVAIRGKKTGLCYRWEEGACLPTPGQVESLKALLSMDLIFDDALAAAYAARDSTISLARDKASENAARNTDVLSYRTVTSGTHPCEKPVALIEDLITSSGSKLSSILDPFMGSGTTGVACTKLGRGFVGIENNLTYFDTACRRIEQAQRQGDMFVQAAE